MPAGTGTGATRSYHTLDRVFATPDKFAELPLKTNIFDGIAGILRFGNGDSPELFLALGDVLALHGERLFAYRAYERAKALHHPRVEYISDMMAGLKGRIYYPDQISEQRIAAEISEAKSWVAAYQQFEDDLVRRGVDTDDSKNYEPFYSKHPRTYVEPAAEVAVEVVSHNTPQIISWSIVVGCALGISFLGWKKISRRSKRASA